MGLLGVGDTMTNIQAEIQKYSQWGCAAGDCGNQAHGDGTSGAHPVAAHPQVQSHSNVMGAAAPTMAAAPQPMLRVAAPAAGAPTAVDAANWQKCMNVYSKTCDPASYWGKIVNNTFPPDFYDQPIYNSDGTVYSCTEQYWTDQGKRDQFNQSYYGATNIYDDNNNVDVEPHGDLYNQYCAAPPPTPWVNPWAAECKKMCSGPDPYNDKSNPYARACRAYCKDVQAPTMDSEFDKLKQFEQGAYGIDPKTWSTDTIGYGKWSPGAPAPAGPPPPPGFSW